MTSIPDLREVACEARGGHDLSAHGRFRVTVGGLLTHREFECTRCGAWVYSPSELLEPDR